MSNQKKNLQVSECDHGQSYKRKSTVQALEGPVAIDKVLL